jgi:hypothetical protein
VTRRTIGCDPDHTSVAVRALRVVESTGKIFADVGRVFTGRRIRATNPRQAEIGNAYLKRGDRRCVDGWSTLIRADERNIRYGGLREVHLEDGSARRPKKRCNLRPMIRLRWTR